jgi:hypothetical protein
MLTTLWVPSPHALNFMERLSDAFGTPPPFIFGSFFANGSHSATRSPRPTPCPLESQLRQHAGHVRPLSPRTSGNVLAIECPPREIHQLPTSPKFIRQSTAGITRKRQQPIQNIFAEPMHAFPRRKLNRIANGLEPILPGDTMKRFEVYIRADDVYVREFRLTH